MDERSQRRKILMFPFGSAGDVHPFVGLALALKERGHDVVIVVNGYFRDLIDRVGLEFVEQGTREEFLDAIGHPDLWHPTKSFAHLFGSGISKALRPQFELISEWHARGPVTVINNCLGFGARIARDKLDVPLVTVHLQPSVLWSAHESPMLPGMPSWAPGWLRRLQYWVGETFFIDPIVHREVNGFRAELGLPRMRKTTRWWHSPDLNICLFPPWYSPPQPDWPKPLTMCSFPLWDESAVTTMLPDVEHFLSAGPPPIVFAPGSANSQAQAFFRAAADACLRLRKRGLLLTKFAEQLPRDLPDGVKAFPYVPFSQVLPRSSALVHHGGIGTAAQGLRAGIPQLVMPLAHDQPDNAARLKRLGVADALPPAKFTGANVAARLASLVESPATRSKCEEIREKLEHENPFDEACRAIGRLK